LAAGGREATTLDAQTEARPVAAQEAPPVIDWSAGMRQPDGTKTGSAREDGTRPWTVDFVTTPEQGPDDFHPNNRAKVELPVGARLAKALAPLPRR